MALEPAEAEKDWLSIGQLAALANVSIRTIRYYEELGILPPPPRTSGNTRRYPNEYRFYLDGIKALKDVGFELRELALVSRLHLGVGDGPMPDEERHLAETVIATKIQSLRRRIRVLERLSTILTEEPDAAYDHSSPSRPTSSARSRIVSNGQPRVRQSGRRSSGTS